MSLEPLVCLVAALALRQGGGRPRLTLDYLQRGEGGGAGGGAPGLPRAGRVGGAGLSCGE